MFFMVILCPGKLFMAINLFSINQLDSRQKLCLPYGGVCLAQ